jgi:hypothetical protein
MASRQVRGEGKIALLKGFVRQFLGIADANSKASRRQVGSCRSLLCSVHPERVCWHSFLGILIHPTRRCVLNLLRGLASSGDSSANGEVLYTILPSTHFVNKYPSGMKEMRHPKEAVVLSPSATHL